MGKNPNLLKIKMLLFYRFPDTQLMNISNILVVDVQGEIFVLKNRTNLLTDVSNTDNFVLYNALSKYVIDIDSLSGANIKYDLNLFPADVIHRVNTYITAS